MIARLSAQTRWYARTALSVLAFSLVAPATMAQKLPAQRPVPRVTANTGNIHFVFVYGLNQTGLGPSIINGREANTSDWPASVYGTFKPPNPQYPDQNCSATIIGPDVLLTAAHCVGNGASADVSSQTTTIGGAQCAHEPAAILGVSRDLALCKLNEVVRNVRYETVIFGNQKLGAGRSVIVTGYGCTALDQLIVSPRFEIGDAVVSSLQNNGVVNTRPDLDSGLVCSGDSGGGDFVAPAPLGKASAIITSATPRALIGVNMAFNYDGFSVPYSEISSVAAEADFFNTWARKNETWICGIKPASDTVHPSIRFDATACKEPALP